MHPSPIKHARSLHVLTGVLLLAAVLLVPQGCSSSTGRTDAPFMPSDTITSAVERDSALAVLSSMRRSAFDSAFAALDDHAFSRYVRTEQLTPSGTTTAVRSYLLRYRPGNERGTIQRRDSSGVFRSGGWLNWTAPDRAPTERPTNVAAQVLPDQPAYIEPRTREAFRYALRADTLLDETPAYVLEAVARDRGTGQQQSVRYVRLLIDRASRQLIGLATVRSGRVLLFGENTQMSMRLRRGPDGTWVPHVTRVRASVNVPLRTSRQFRTVSAYYNYR